VVKEKRKNNGMPEEPIQELPLPLGKLPFELLAQVLARAPMHDPRVLLGPGVGLDCAVLDLGSTLLVFKAEPITFATDKIGWYAVQIAVNDIATTGAQPRWMLTTLLLPEKATTPSLVMEIGEQVFSACESLGISVIGGHTEITYGLDRPILMSTLIGEVAPGQLVTPRGASPGDRVLLTKGVPIEAAAILAREFPERLRPALTDAEIRQAADFLYAPGISVYRDAQVAVQAGGVTGMHDPTEGGLAAALWEMAEASGHRLRVDTRAVPVPDLSARICRVFGLDPLASIASGSLLITARPESVAGIRAALESEGIACAEIGAVEPGAPEAWDGEHLLPRPARDEITRVFG
jgi:hydrogenase expression/formation protein HypE